MPRPLRPAPIRPGEREERSEDRTWLLRSFPIDAGEPSGGAVVVVFKDVTDEREVTRRLIHAEKMSAVGQLAGGVAHEINKDPLGGILAFAQLMSREDRPGEDLENLRLIHDAAMRAKRIVESLLRFSWSCVATSRTSGCCTSGSRNGASCRCLPSRNTSAYAGRAAGGTGQRGARTDRQARTGRRRTEGI